MDVSSINITGALAADVFSEKPLLPPLTEMLVMRHYPQEKEKHHSQKIHMMRWFRYTGKMGAKHQQVSGKHLQPPAVRRGAGVDKLVMGIPWQKIIDGRIMAYQTNDRKAAQCQVPCHDSVAGGRASNQAGCCGTTRMEGESVEIALTKPVEGAAPSASIRRRLADEKRPVLVAFLAGKIQSLLKSLCRDTV